MGSSSVERGEVEWYGTGIIDMTCLHVGLGIQCWAGIDCVAAAGADAAPI